MTLGLEVVVGALALQLAVTRGVVMSVVMAVAVAVAVAVTVPLMMPVAVVLPAVVVVRAMAQLMHSVTSLNLLGSRVDRPFPSGEVWTDLTLHCSHRRRRANCRPRSSYILSVYLKQSLSPTR